MDDFSSYAQWLGRQPDADSHAGVPGHDGGQLPGRGPGQ
jgi:hypothetical protein